MSVHCSKRKEEVVTTTSLRRGSIQQLSHGFLTDLIDRLWPCMKVAVAEMIKEMIREKAADLPSALSTMRVTKIDLGHVPMRLDNIVIHQASSSRQGKDDPCSSLSFLQFDMDVVWDSDCDIQMKVDYMGSFGVKDFVLQGRMSVLFKPLTTDALPCFTAIQYAFVNPPELHLNFTGLAQVADFAILDTAIRAMIHETFQSMVVLPNRMMYKMDAVNDFFASYQPPLGILHLILESGRGFVVEHRLLRAADIPDVYCNISLGSSKVWRTSTISDNLTPVWNESADFVVSDYEQQISVHAFDQDDEILDADDDLGLAKLNLSDLLLSPGKTAEVELIDTRTKQRIRTGAFVQLRGEICPLTTSNMTSIEQPDPAPNSLCGMLIILVSRAYELPVAKREAASYVKVTYNYVDDRSNVADKSLSFVTSTVVDYPGLDALNPQYDTAFEIPLTSEMMRSNTERNYIQLTLMNGSTVLGTTEVTFADLKSAANNTITEKRVLGTTDNALLEFQISLHAIELPTKSAAEASAVTLKGLFIGDSPIEESSPLDSQSTRAGSLGKVQVTIVKGHGFQIQPKKHIFGKADVPDIYCKVRFGSSPDEWRTSTIRNSVLPFWNESKVFPLRDHGEVIRISVFDEDKNQTDDSIGQCRATVGSILLSGGGIREMQLLNKGQGTDAYLVIHCELLHK